MLKELDNVTIMQTERFFSVQGEALYSGVPTLFFRSSKCSLRCTWCDTKRSSADDADKNATEVTLLEVYNWIMQSKIKHLVITGGEPMLFQAKIEKLIKALPGEYTIEIETAGQFKSSPYLAKRCHYNISPKNPIFQPGPYKSATEPRILGAKDSLSSYIVKFVYADDLPWIQSIIQKYSIPKEKVWLMPIGEVYSQESYLKTAEVCLQTGYRFCPRVHTLIWGNKPGT